MRKLGGLLVFTAFGVSLGGPLEPILSAETRPAVAADKKVKASVTGTGKSKSAAEDEARKTARDVAGSINYRTIRKNTTGSGESWTCTMTIEYAAK